MEIGCLISTSDPALLLLCTQGSQTRCLPWLSAWHRHAVPHVLPEFGIQRPFVGHVVSPPLNGTLHFHEVLEGLLKLPKLQPTGLAQSLQFYQNHLGVILDEGAVQGDLLLVGKLPAVDQLRSQDKNLPPALSYVVFHGSGCIWE